MKALVEEIIETVADPATTLPDSATCATATPGGAADVSGAQAVPLTIEAARQMPLLYFVTKFAASKKSTKRRHRSAATPANEERWLRAVARCWPEFCTKAVGQLTNLDIQAMCRAISDARLGNGSEYANNTYNNYVRAVLRLVRFLTRLPHSVLTETEVSQLCLGAAGEMADANTHEQDLPSPTQEDTMLAYVQARCANGHQRLASFIMFMILWFYGIRKGMVRRVMRQDIQLDQSRITFSFNKQRGGKVWRITFPMPAILREALTRYLSVHPADGDRPALKIKSINKLLKTAAAAAGLQEFNHRTFRKLFITRALQAGIEVPVIAAIVGHRDGGKSILNNYHQLCPDKIEEKISLLLARHGVGGATLATKLELQQAVEQLFRQVPGLPADVAQLCLEFLHYLGRRVEQQDHAGIRSLLKRARLDPLAPLGDAHPSQPHLTPLPERRIIAANVRHLMWREGIGVHELTVLLALPATSLYDLLQGTRAVPHVIDKLLGHFQVSRDQLRCTTPRYDTQLVLRNLNYLASRVGVTRLPMPETLAQVVGNRQLPQGNLLRCLAERLKLPLGTLLTCELAASPELVPAVIQMAGTTLVANLRLLTLLAGTDCKGVCQSTGLNLHQVEAYVAGRRLPPEGNLLRLATAFGLTREALLGALPQPDPAAVGQRIHTRLGAMGLKGSTAAGKMTLGVSKFLAVAAGTTLPDGHQLKKICDFLGLSKWELLGLQPVAFPASLGSWGIPAAAVLDTASNRAGYAELPMAA